MTGECGGGFVDLVDADALWDGEMESFEVGDSEVLVVKVDGQTRAYDGSCPHQGMPLVEGRLDGRVLTCWAHEWQFDVLTGQGVNPRNERLTSHDVRITEDGVVQVRLRAES
jgi:nitrite reductase/ring-hydroxylating ferredoxin subunit